MRYMIYNESYRMYEVMETKCCKTKPELKTELVLATPDLEEAIKHLRGKK